MRNLGNTEAERNYRLACHKMLAALDTRRAIHAASGAVAAAHQEMIGDGTPLLKNWGSGEELDHYRRVVEQVVDRLDKRDQLRAADTFRDALLTLHNLGEQLAYPSAGVAAEPSTAMVKMAHDVKTENYSLPAGLALEPKRNRKSFQDLRSILEANGYDASPNDAADVSALERELAGLQSELASFQAAS